MISDTRAYWAHSPVPTSACMRTKIGDASLLVLCARGAASSENAPLVEKQKRGSLGFMGLC